jgi:hypothetical protein
MTSTVLDQIAEMSNFKRFNTDDIDETLTRVVTHRGTTFLMFPYLDALDATPKMNSVSRAIDGSAATVDDFLKLSALARQVGESGRWFLNLNTVWLMPKSEGAAQKPDRVPRPERH